MWTLAAWLHDIDPFIWHISGNFGIRWYGAAYLLGFALGYLILRHLAKRERIRLKPEQVGDFVMAIVVGVLVGGRLGSVLLYNPDLLWTIDASPPWWGVLAINRGGMASHGGMVGCLLGCWWFSRRHGVPLFQLADLVTFVAPIGLGAGRLANFINGELLGRPLAEGETLPWAVKFPQEMSTYWANPPKYFEPELLDKLEPFCRQYGGVTEAEWRQALLQPQTDWAISTMYRLSENLTEAIQRGEQKVVEIVEPLLAARHPSQLYQALAEGLIVGLVLWLVWMKPRCGGVVTGWFLIVYGILRIVTEHWRLPDANLQMQRILGLSRGQLYSVPLIAAGALLLWYAVRKGAKHGGWWRGEANRAVPTT
ncbi:MAG: prolipoprotein diacylglyceryl transferase [Phycisphaerales bacterium JB038]